MCDNPDEYDKEKVAAKKRSKPNKKTEEALIAAATGRTTKVENISDLTKPAPKAPKAPKAKLEPEGVKKGKATGKGPVRSQMPKKPKPDLRYAKAVTAAEGAGPLTKKVVDDINKRLEEPDSPQGSTEHLSASMVLNPRADLPAAQPELRAPEATGKIDYDALSSKAYEEATERLHQVQNRVPPSAFEPTIQKHVAPDKDLTVPSYPSAKPLGSGREEPKPSDYEVTKDLEQRARVLFWITLIALALLGAYTVWHFFLRQ